MLRITLLNSPAGAKSYHKSSLSKQGEYYGEEVDACYHGKLSEKLGVGKVSTENFGMMVDGVHPETLDRLTLNNTDRRVGWDLTILPPKSFSIASVFMDDPDLEKAFLESNRLMMLKAEERILAQNNSSSHRSFESTSSGVWASFHHRVGRPVEHQYLGRRVYGGQMLQHVHNVLFSLTYSPSKDKFLAIDPYHIYKSAPFLQSYFHNTLSNKIAELGYVIERTEDAWEIKGVSNSIIRRFSERGNIVANIAQERGITDPKEVAKIAARSRVSKNKSIPEDQLLDVWKAQLSDTELSVLQSLKNQESNANRKISVREAIDRSIEHFLERNSIAETDRVIGHAMSLCYGMGHDLKEFERDLAQRDNIIYGSDGIIPILSTTELVRSENELITKATNGKGTIRPINPNYKIKREYLNQDQRNAVKSILSSKDLVVALEGYAGTGKSKLLTELGDGISEKGLKLIPIAPSSQAVDVLREDFKSSQTIASFLINKKEQELISGNILVVDESSMIGVKTMNDILTIAKEKNARQVVLSGNIRQHSSPGEYGDALRILQQRAQIQTIHVKENMRQQPALFKEAVNLIANKKTVSKGYRILDEKLNAVQEIPDKDERFHKITDGYINSLKAKRSAIIISPTNFEKDVISELLREKLKVEGMLKKKERIFETLKDLSLTQSQKRDPLQFQPGRVVRMIKNQKNVKAGSHYEVISNISDQTIRVKDLKSGAQLNLSLDKPEFFNLYAKTKTPIAVGELIKPTANLVSKEGSKINTGTPQKVKGFVKGNILLENGKTLSKDSFHIAYNYASTSYAAQGRTCQDAFISLSEMSAGAINDQAFYVSVSRARSRIQIITDNKDQLKSAIKRSGERMSAHDVEKQHERTLLEKRQRLDYEKRTKNERDYAVSKQRRTTITRDISEGVTRP
jgi:conjugative relaxase-like TrwC/TraI family protein